MEKLFIDRWDKNKHLLQQYFATTPQSEYDSYKAIVEAIIRFVLNPQDESDLVLHIFNTKVTEIDDGDCEGCLLFLFHISKYKPSHTDYIITNDYYGSCSGCDTLQGISHNSSKLPTESQVSEYMVLALHLVQKMKFIYKRGE